MTNAFTTMFSGVNSGVDEGLRNAKQAIDNWLAKVKSDMSNTTLKIGAISYPELYFNGYETHGASQISVTGYKKHHGQVCRGRFPGRRSNLPR